MSQWNAVRFALARSRFLRLVTIQAHKVSPLNLRRVLRISPARNAKTLALAVEACAARHVDPTELVEESLRIQVRSGEGAGWGYPFDWQSRSFWCPRNTPTAVCTGFVVRALRAALPGLPEDLREACVRAILDSAQMVLHDLNRTPEPPGFCFSYSPVDRSQVVNATLLAAEILAHAAVVTERRELLEEGLPTVEWALSRQAGNGGWRYGSAGHHAWEDSFHTGFNIMSLDRIAAACAHFGIASGIEPRLRLAYEHFKGTFFESDGWPRYYEHSKWPGDAHTAAVAIITFLQFETRDPDARACAERTLRWALTNLWNERGHFDYQVHRFYRVRIPYLRWSQAWMLLALARWEAASSYSGRGD